MGGGVSVALTDATGENVDPGLEARSGQREKGGKEAGERAR